MKERDYLTVLRGFPVRKTATLLWGVLFASLLLGFCRKGVEPGSFPADEGDARPWVFWYWMHGAVSAEGITADLEAMRDAGIGGAYLFAIKDTNASIHYPLPLRQLTPGWWRMAGFACREADRLGLQLAFHACDGFTTAGGPWITPELSMQKVVWSDTVVSGGQHVRIRLPQPPAVSGYYRDIALYAFPAPSGWDHSSRRRLKDASSTLGDKGLRLLSGESGGRSFSSRDSCRIGFSFAEPLTCRSVVLTTGWHNYQSNRLILEVSDDGLHFRPHCRLEPYRHGWQDLGIASTHRIDPVTARHFRFVYDPAGSEPGAEDLDNAKWSPELQISGIELSGLTKIDQYEGKSGVIWRIAGRNGEEQIPASACIDPSALAEITRFMDKEGILDWEVPEGDWMILRMGHTSTGHTNYTGGGGLGLECDKLNPEAVTLQFDRWFGELFRQAGPEAARVMKIFHVDSWECGSQNWSPVFREEFLKKRGYDLLSWLPVMAGFPVQSAAVSEKVLYDVRMTLSELAEENFFGLLAGLAHERNCLFSAESTAPVFCGDGMAHYRETDIPMGEFWLRSPSHDKPNDILDAVSAAHLYGKRIVQAEAFTEIRLDWDEHPGMLKTLADRNFAAGINRLAFHVFAHNPWKDRKPGMTLDKVGLFFQRDQTWWGTGRAWVEYIARVQEILQKGVPVSDIALFTGEEIPRRAILPDRLVPVLPGIMGVDRVAAEGKRLRNDPSLVRELPAGVRTVAAMADPAEWCDPLRGYRYDSFNRDALLRLATVKDNRIVLPSGVSYDLLVIPGSRKMAPGPFRMSREVAVKLLELARQGATLLFMELPAGTPGWQNDPNGDAELQKTMELLFSGKERVLDDGKGHTLVCTALGAGRIIRGPWLLPTFDILGLPPDFMASEMMGERETNLAWTHRREADDDIYFIANQKDSTLYLNLSFRIGGKTPELMDPLTGERRPCVQWEEKEGVTTLPYRFLPRESLFVLFRQRPVAAAAAAAAAAASWVETKPVMELDGPWLVQFDTQYGGPEAPVVMKTLADWSLDADPRIRHYSGTAVYRVEFPWDRESGAGGRVYLDPGLCHDLVRVRLNGTVCGTCWTPSPGVRIDGCLRKGQNELELEVTNSWHNRIKGDHDVATGIPVTRTTAPYRLEGRLLLPAGLLGPVTLTAVP